MPGPPSTSLGSIGIGLLLGRWAISFGLFSEDDASVLILPTLALFGSQLPSLLLLLLFPFSSMLSLLLTSPPSTQKLPSATSTALVSDLASRCDSAAKSPHPPLNTLNLDWDAPADRDVSRPLPALAATLSVSPLRLALPRSLISKFVLSLMLNPCMTFGEWQTTWCCSCCSCWAPPPSLLALACSCACDVAAGAPAGSIEPEPEPPSPMKKWFSWTSARISLLPLVVLESASSLVRESSERLSALPLNTLPLVSGIATLGLATRRGLKMVENSLLMRNGSM
mmetsp:Transcript_7263/g.13552  ORF Transcript_7263/g.13552 Transcript_7263/m.13552 type:complete len:282 (-) Transcript_7263:1286-2131(-)